MFLKRILFLVFFIPAVLSAQSYLWPTNSSKYLASSFCEYRPGHYHAAIDIKTWNKEGYSCYAVDDGTIYRINLSVHGAGKALYIKLKDGNFAVYFHLQKFPEKIEKELRKLQINQKKYNVEWWPKDWSVKKGEIVAYTGQTGIGVPHLHFEIRNAGNVPINPIPFFKKDIKDNIRPQLEKLLVIPQDKNSSVNNSFIPADYTLKHIKDGVYVVKQPIYSHGRIGLAINGLDQANDVNNKLDFYSMKLSVDGQKIFESSYDKISFSQSRFVDIDIYYPEKQKSGTRYHKLYIEPFNQLDIYNRSLNDGLIQAADKEVIFEIEIEDFFDNISILKGSILPYPPDFQKTSDESIPDRSAFFSLFLPDSIQSIELYSNVQKTEDSKIKYFEFIERTPIDGGAQTLVKVSLPGSDIDTIYSSIMDMEGHTYNSSNELDYLNGQKIFLESQLMGDHILFSIAQIKDLENPSISVIQGNDTKTYNLNTGSEFILQADEVTADSIRLQVKSQNIIIADSVFLINKIERGKNQQFAFYKDTVLIESARESAYEDLFYQVDLKPVANDFFEFPFYNKALHLHAGGHILNRSVKLSIKPDSAFLPLDKVSIYSLNDDDVDYEGGSFNPQTGYVSTHTKTFATFMLIADTVAPSIEIIYPQKNTYSSLGEFSFKTDDNLSGIGEVENIEIHFDDSYIVPEWDPERKLVTGNLYFKPSTGAHMLKIEVKDRVGNIARKNIDLFIK